MKLATIGLGVAAYEPIKAFPDEGHSLTHFDTPSGNVGILAKCISASLNDRKDLHFMCLGFSPCQPKLYIRIPTTNAVVRETALLPDWGLGVRFSLYRLPAVSSPQQSSRL